MKWSWKDFFYFQQNDKRAILLLLILIVLCIGFTLFSNKWLSDKELVRQQETFDEFEHFQANLPDKETIKPVFEPQIQQQVAPAKSTAAGKLKEGEKIDLNGADIQTIKRIPGIGDSFAQRIYDYHNRLGGFVSAEQLMEIEGISPKRYEKMLPYVEFKRKHNKLKINKLSTEVLAGHPYINAKQAQSIVSACQAKKLEKIEDLSGLPDFSPRDIDRLSPYLSFD